MKTVRLLFGMMLVFFTAFAPIVAKAHNGHANKHRHGIYTPHWVPSYVVRENIRHVYFPAYEVYFDRWNGNYIYFTRQGWITSSYLPYGLRGVNFRRAYKIGVAIDSSRPYTYNNLHRSNYRRYYGKRGYSYSDGHGYKQGNKNDHGHHKGNKKNGKYYNDIQWDNDQKEDNRRDPGRKDQNYSRRGGRRN